MRTTRAFKRYIKAAYAGEQLSKREQSISRRAWNASRRDLKKRIEQSKLYTSNDQAQGMATPQGTWTMSDQNKRETGDGNGHDSGHSLPLLVRPKMAFTYIAHVSRTRFEFKPITMVWGTIIVDKTTIDEDTWEVIAEECQEYTSEFPSYIGEMNPALRQCQCKEFSRFLQKWSNNLSCDARSHNQPDR